MLVKIEERFVLLLAAIHFNFFFLGVRKMGHEIGGRGELKFQFLRVGGFWGKRGKIIKNSKVGNLEKIKFSGNLVGNLSLKVKQ